MAELTSESTTSQPAPHGASPSLTIFLKSKGKLGYVDGCVQTLKTTDSGYDQWEITNSLIMGWLIHSTVSEIGEGYLSMDTTQDIWEAVVATTTRRVVVLLCFRLPLLMDLPWPLHPLEMGIIVPVLLLRRIPSFVTIVLHRLPSRGRGDRSGSRGGRSGPSGGRGPNAQAHHFDTVKPQSLVPVVSSADISGLSTSELEVTLRHLLDRRTSSSSSGPYHEKDDWQCGRNKNGLYILDQADKLDHLGVAYEGQT
ncbi:hypothetical protein CsSME_00030816 [Camellia sinensis var. sinensis]